MGKYIMVIAILVMVGCVTTGKPISNFEQDKFLKELNERNLHTAEIEREKEIKIDKEYKDYDLCQKNLIKFYIEKSSDLNLIKKAIWMECQISRAPIVKRMQTTRGFDLMNNKLSQILEGNIARALLLKK